MRSFFFTRTVLISALTGGCLLADSRAVSSSAEIDPAGKARANAQYARMPMAFEINQGQTDGRVKALARGSGYGLFLNATEATFVFADRKKGSVLRWKPVGADSNARFSAVEPLGGTINYYIGNDPSKWRTDVATYGKVKFESIYPGVDLVYYGNQQQLEYDFIVSPGTDPQAIGLAIEGARIRIDSHGDLVMRTAMGEIRHHKPVVYQEIDGARREIAGNYVLRPNHQIGFRIGAYDRTQKLVIDPTLNFSTYSGGSQYDAANAVAVDGAGDTFIGGVTASSDYPTNGLTPPPFPTFGGMTDGFLTVLLFNNNGGKPFISSYYGGSGADQINAVTVTTNVVPPNVYLAGTTTSTDLPTHLPIQGHNAGCPTAPANNVCSTADAFVVVVGFPNNILFSDYLGGSGNDLAGGVHLDPLGNIVVAGSTNSPDFPTLNPLQAHLAGSYDLFVTKFSVRGAPMLFSTYLGGAGADMAKGVDVNQTTGLIYITGITNSPTFPSAGLHPSSTGGVQAFLAGLKSDGSSLSWAKVFGGAGVTEATGVAADVNGNAFVTGFTNSTAFPTTANPLSGTLKGPYDAFLAKFNSAGTTLFSTYFGGSGVDEGLAVAVDGSGNAFIAGTTSSTNLPVSNAIQSTSGGGFDGFVAKIAPDGSSITYCTYFGGSGSDVITGIAVGSQGNATFAGYTNSTNLPTTTGVFQSALKGSFDAFGAKIKN